MNGRTILIATLAALWSGTATAQPPSPDWWPCVQRYEPELSAGVFWTGSLPDAALWRDNRQIVELADAVTDRALRFEKAQAMIDELIKGVETDASWWVRFGEKITAVLSGGERRERATLLIGAMTDAVNERRQRVLDGIKRYGERQQMMVRRIEQQAKKIHDIEEGSGDAAELEDLNKRQTWDVRVFEEREKLSEPLCEQAVLQGQRFFALGRHIIEVAGLKQEEE